MTASYSHQAMGPSDPFVGGPEYSSDSIFQPSSYNNTKPYSTVHVEKGQTQGSPESSSTGCSQLPEKLGRVSTARIQPKLSKSTSWAMEIVSLLIATGAMIAMIVLLAQYDDHPLPEWPHEITFNTMIALLATLMVAALAVPSSSALSQLKWIRFMTGAAPLSDMEVFDEASRGSWGAALLLVKLRGG